MHAHDEETFSQVQGILAKQLKISRDEIQQHTSLKDDLGIDSVDALDMVFGLENHFSVKIDDEDLIQLKTVHDVIKLILKKKVQYQ